MGQTKFILQIHAGQQKGFANQPRSARRVPQPHREYLSETVFEPEARKCSPAR